MEPEKKCKCLFGLTESCEARKFVEEAIPKIDLSEIIQKSRTSLPNFDDRQVAYDLGDAVGRGISQSLKPLVRGIGGHDTIKVMASLCMMCPKRKEAQKGFP